MYQGLHARWEGEGELMLANCLLSFCLAFGA